MRRFHEQRRLASALLLAAIAAAPVLCAQAPASAPGSPQPPAPATPAAPQPQLPPQQQGDSLMAQQRYQAAIEAYKKGPRNSPELENKLGIAYQLLGNLNEGARCYQSAIRLDPRNPSYYNNLGTVFDLLKQYGAAERMYRKALKIDPRSALTEKNLGTVLMAEHKYNKGREVYQRALELDPNIFEPGSSPKVDNPAQGPGARRNELLHGQELRSRRPTDMPSNTCAWRSTRALPTPQDRLRRDFEGLHGIPAFEQLLAAHKNNKRPFPARLNVSWRFRRLRPRGRFRRPNRSCHEDPPSFPQWSLEPGAQRQALARMSAPPPAQHANGARPRGQAAAPARPGRRIRNGPGRRRAGNRDRSRRGPLHHQNRNRRNLHPALQRQHPHRQKQVAPPPRPGQGREQSDAPPAPPQTLKPTDIKVGDPIAAVGEADAATKSVGAVIIVLIDPERARQMREMQANYGKTWLMGKVTAIDGAKVTLMGSMDNAPHTMMADENTEFRRRRDPITLADVQVGEMMRADGAVKDGVFVAATIRVMGAPEGGTPRLPRTADPATETPSASPAAAQPR